MMPEPEKVEITALVTWLGMRKKIKNPAVLFLGARAGGLFRSQELCDILQPFSKRTLHELSQSHRFEECYKVLSQRQFSERELDSILTQSLQHITHTDADVCIADMVKQGIFDVIISSNIDDLIEDSFVQVEMRELFDYDVFIPEHMTPEGSIYHERPLPCKVIKAFGALSSKKYCIIERGAYLDSSQNLKNLLETYLTQDVLAVGLDPTWDEEILRMFPTQGGVFWLVGEEELMNRAVFARIVRARQAKYLVDSEQHEIWKAIYWHLHGGMPINFQLIHNIDRQLQAISRDMQLLKRDTQDIRKDVQELHILFQRLYERQLTGHDKT
ncbi:hypothetical protein KSF_066470 [Reticulibacter mediterranei]|uniref:SIR2-like domain-containing protein n=1 Tax=Reticulibacter mediterranei TaxID=2778369 RepID=A0A8J3IJC0_9CHLR|nr:hypothetical protein [Reticulibacter mediterranei]GHO96599.1 hypothetical protein KSF_066470 [Reticulibacter mediterranei]